MAIACTGRQGLEQRDDEPAPGRGQRTGRRCTEDLVDSLGTRIFLPRWPCAIAEALSVDADATREWDSTLEHTFLPFERFDPWRALSSA